MAKYDAIIAPKSEQSAFLNIMYSPKIDKHTPKLYRISRAVGKPMTKVADDLITFSYQHLKSIYVDIDDVEIDKILCTEYDHNLRSSG